MLCRTQFGPPRVRHWKRSFMDNLTHGLFGLVLARAGLGQGKRWAAPLLVVAANAPDFESLIPSASTAEYLLYHRGLSHSLVGVLVESLLLTLATLAIVKWRKLPDAAPPAHVFAVAFTGVLSHIFLDWLNTYGIHPWQPFADTVYYGDLTFIIDPWFWMLLWGGCYLSAPLSRAANWIFGVMGIVMTMVLVYGMSFGLSGKAVVLWVVLALAVLALRTKRTRSGHIFPSAGKWALAGVSIYLGMLLGFSRTAVHLVRAERPDIPAENFSAHPTPGVPWRYTVLVDRGHTVEQFTVHLARNEAIAAPSFETRRDDPALQRIQHTPEYRAWMYFARHRVATWDGDTLLLGDARYKLAARRDWTEMRIKPPPR